MYEKDVGRLENKSGPLKPLTDVAGDNFNREIGNSRWGKSESLDVFHIAGVLRQVRAPSRLSRSHPELPLNELDGKVLLELMLTVN